MGLTQIEEKETKPSCVKIMLRNFPTKEIQEMGQSLEENVLSIQNFFLEIEAIRAWLHASVNNPKEKEKLMV